MHASSTLWYKQAVIHYIRFGYGKRVLVYLHGYGEDGFSAMPIQDSITASFTCIAIDLPFHGKTIWNMDTPFLPNDLFTLLQAIFKQEGLATTPFSLAGYSMGGRLALALYQYNAAYIDRLFLIAPDGLKMNFWYWLGTQTILGNQIFKYTMQQPKWFFTLLTFTKKMQLINETVYKFSNQALDNAGSRLQLYQRWTGMRFLNHLYL